MEKKGVVMARFGLKEATIQKVQFNALVFYFFEKVEEPIWRS